MRFKGMHQKAIAIRGVIQPLSLPATIIAALISNARNLIMAAPLKQSPDPYRRQTAYFPLVGASKLSGMHD